MSEDDDAEGPFDEFDGEYDERAGDPFAHLDDAATDRESGAEPDPRPEATRGGSGDTAESAAGRDPFEYPEDRPESGSVDRPESGSADRVGSEDRDGSESTTRAGAGAADRSEPEAEAGSEGPRETGGENGRREVDVNARTGDPFADVDVSGADPFASGASAFEDVGVEGVDPDEVWDRLTGDAEARSAAEGDSSGAADGPEDDVVEVSKHSFCEGCEHVSTPPDVHCTHEGTNILEFTDVETVRVANCPVVAERRELGGMDE